MQKLNLHEYITKEGIVKVDIDDLRTLFSYFDILLDLGTIDYLDEKSNHVFETIFDYADFMKEKYFLLNALRYDEKVAFDQFKYISNNVPDDQSRRMSYGHYIEIKHQRELMQKKLEKRKKQYEF